MDKIAVFSLSYDGGLDDPPGAWDSTGVERLDQLPELVELKVALWEVDAQGDPWPGLEVTRVVNLPVRPFRLAPDDADAAKGKCGASVTVATCLAKHTAQLAAASTSLAAAISEARQTIEDACWNDKAPPAALQRLKLLMKGLAGFDPSACP